MHSDQYPYYELLNRFREEPASRFVAIAEAWLAENPAERTFLEDFGRREGTPFPPASTEDLWRLYALSRNHDVLVQKLLSAEVPEAPDERELITSAHTALLTGLGLARFVAGPFHPFFHEIVRVEPSADPDAPIEVVAELWPGFALGPMMFARAGVRVRGGANHIDARVAETSVLYWAYVRANRPVSDLSHGWGHNSQWRTRFRRDYHLDDTFRYNVDGGPLEDHDELTDAERLELLRHRCFITTTRDSVDLFPFGMCATEHAGAAVLLR